MRHFDNFNAIHYIWIEQQLSFAYCVLWLVQKIL